MKMKLSCVLLLALCLGACQRETPSVQAQGVAALQGALQVSAELLPQLTFAEVAQAPVSDVIRVAGEIVFDEQRLARIGATITGRVTAIDALLGQSVRRGDVLARINSSELSSQQLAYLKAKAALDLNKRNAERAKSLFEADVISAAEWQRRESEYKIAQAEARAAADQLRLLGVTDAAISKLGAQGTIDSVTPVVATLDGVIVERHLAQGQVVQPADALFVVADLSRVWASARVPEQQVAHVSTGQTVTIEIPALGHEKVTGRLIFVGQTIDPDTRTVLVRTELDNAHGRLKPAMLSSMLIETKPQERLVIPASAVVRENDQDHVFRVEANNFVMLQPVTLGPERGGQRVVLKGLKQGEKIVATGAFHLNNERNRKELEGS